jgi:sarcosine oxidase
MKTYDCIVLGFGGVGSAAMRFAALKGWSVLGIDRFGPAHDKGSSHGHTRVFRKAYFEHPNYVPLLQESAELWDELNKRHRTKPSIKQLMNPTGALTVGLTGSETVEGVLRSCQQHQLQHECFTAAEIKRRLPIFNLTDDHVGVFEPDAGYLLVEQCVTAMISQALKHGATIQSDTIVQDWAVDESGLVTVTTDRGVFQAERLIVTAGAWSKDLLPFLHKGLTVLRKQQHWYQLDRVDQKQVNDFPVFLFEEPDGQLFYGVPEIDYLGMKVCRHSGGQPIADPTKLDRSLDNEEFSAVESFMDQRMHFGRKRLVHHSTCMYTMSNDGHFIVDQVPDHDNVVFAAGLSGHGFKMAPTIGKHLVDVLAGERKSEFDFLRLRAD